MSSINHMQFSNVVWHTQTSQSILKNKRIDMLTTTSRILWLKFFSFMVFMLSITIYHSILLSVLVEMQTERERMHLGRCIQNYSIHSFGLSPFINSLSFAYKKTHREWNKIKLYNRLKTIPIPLAIVSF